jgi:hypothetical protein
VIKLNTTEDKAAIEYDIAGRGKARLLNGEIVEGGIQAVGGLLGAGLAYLGEKL